MIIIPIGVQCSTTRFIKHVNKSKETLPFDWMFSTPKFVFEMLTLLLEKNMNIEELVKNHFFYCEKRASLNRPEHYYTCKYGNASYNTKYNVIFPHDEVNIENINKYIRRFERLKHIIINSVEEIYFIYTSPSSIKNGNFTIDNNIVIQDVYFYLSEIYNLIAKFRNNYKIIAFDAINQEPIEQLNEKIILCKLNKCNVWYELLPQMSNYEKIFI